MLALVPRGGEEARECLGTAGNGGDAATVSGKRVASSLPLDRFLTTGHLGKVSKCTAGSSVIRALQLGILPEHCWLDEEMGQICLQVNHNLRCCRNIAGLG